MKFSFPNTSGILVGFGLAINNVHTALANNGERLNENLESTGRGFDPSTTPSLPTLGLENVDDPLAAVDSVLLNFVINPIFFLAGGAAVIVIMYAAFQMIKGQGDEEGLTNTKNTLIWAFAGLALVLLSYTIVSNLIEIVLTEL